MFHIKIILIVQMEVTVDGQLTWNPIKQLNGDTVMYYYNNQFPPVRLGNQVFYCLFFFAFCLEFQIIGFVISTFITTPIQLGKTPHQPPSLNHPSTRFRLR